MGDTLVLLEDNWTDGVITSAQPDAIPATAVPHALNTELVWIGAGQCKWAKRAGCTVLNAVQTPGGTAIVGQYEYRPNYNGVVSPQHLLLSHTGRMDVVSTSGSLTSVSATAATHADNLFPSFATANDLCFYANGTDQKKVRFTGTANTVSAFGIATPTTAPTLTDEGTAGNHDGTYEGRVTFYNSTTGHESSAGPTSGTVTVATNKILWSSLPISTNTDVTSRKLYIRNTATQANFYLAATVSDNTSTQATTDIADTSLSLIGPDTAENDPPPSGIKYLCWHGSRMFAATDSTLYYSKVGYPEAFDPDYYEYVNSSDGQRIMGILSHKDRLLIFKENSVYTLDGDDPASWTITLTVPDIGCVSHRSIIVAEGVIYWWSEDGPVSWTGDGIPTPIGRLFINPVITDVNADQWILVCGAADTQNQRVLWSVPIGTDTRCTRLLPFNYRAQRWEAEYWDPLDACTLTSVNDANGIPWVMIGGYGGQVFKLGTGRNDGVGSGTTTGSFVQSGTTTWTITVSGAAFLTANGGLTERKVTLVDSQGYFVARTRIASNNATVLTLGELLTGLTSGATYTLYVGGPYFELDTRWITLDRPVNKKRWEFAYVETLGVTSNPTTVTLDFATNRDTSVGMTKTFTTLSSAGDYTGTGWTSSSVAGGEGVAQRRIRIGRTGVSARLRFRQYAPDAGVTLTRFGFRAEMLGDKLG